MNSSLQYGASASKERLASRAAFQSTPNASLRYRLNARDPQVVDDRISRHYLSPELPLEVRHLPTPYVVVTDRKFSTGSASSSVATTPTASSFVTSESHSLQSARVIFEFTPTSPFELAVSGKKYSLQVIDFR